MAGSFLHLHLALSAFAAAFGRRPEEPSAELSAFLAGSIAPDVGFFPGGPGHFSRRVHHEATADLTRALLRQAQADCEVAFAAGWALHIETDVATHPLINNIAADMAAVPAQRDLWHKRLEWGLDCLMLEASRGQPPLWHQPLNFQMELLARAAGPLFGPDADLLRLRAAARAQPRWLGGIARTLRWSTSRPALKGFTGPLEKFARFDDVVALLTPHPTDEELALRLLDRARSGVAAFQHGWAQRFADMTNRDLDNGEVVLDETPRMKTLA